MEFIIGIWDAAAGLISYLVPFLFVLTIVVFFHELGHFGVARYFGTKVDVFSIGFGKEIYGWFDKHGTRWRISWVPLGGYVKFHGDENAASTPDQEHLKEQRENLSDSELRELFHFKPLHQRAAIVAAGPFANFLLSIIIFSMFFWFVGQQVLTPRVGEVLPDSAAEAAGLQYGDLITEIDGRTIDSFSELQGVVALSSGNELTLVVERDGGLMEIIATPQRMEDVDPFGNKVQLGKLGFQHRGLPEDAVFERYGPIKAVQVGVAQTWFIVEQTMVFVGRLFRGKEDAAQISGPVKIAQISGEVAGLGFVALINLAAVLSVSIGLINLFPIPMLDGGHLLYYAYEAVAGKPLSERVQEYGFRVGLAMVLCLMVFATWNDLSSLSLIPNISGAIN